MAGKGELEHDTGRKAAGGVLQAGEEGGGKPVWPTLERHSHGGRGTPMHVEDKTQQQGCGRDGKARAAEPFAWRQLVDVQLDRAIAADLVKMPAVELFLEQLAGVLFGCGDGVTRAQP